MAGIGVSSVWGVGSWAFLCLSVVALGAWWVYRRTGWVLLAVLGAFGAAHLIQTRESPAAALAAGLGQGRSAATLWGVVAEEPSAVGTKRSRFALDVSQIDVSGTLLRGRWPVLVTMPNPPPLRGDFVRLTGAMMVIPPPRNPSEFDARAWLGLRGITCELDVSSSQDVQIVTPAPKFSLPRLADRCRAWMEQTLRAGIDGDPVVCELLAGMTLGVTSSIPDSLQEQFRNTGTFHLFSVSGLHVGMIAVILWQLLRMVGVSRRMAVFVVIPALFFYALITGWKPPSLRAATMSAIFLIGMLSSRQPVPVNSLCAAGFFLLLWRTNELFNPGFQLSFFVVFAILILSPPLEKMLRKLGQPDPFVPEQLWTRWQKWQSRSAKSAGALLAVSLAAWLGSLPLIVHYFHLVSFSALPANFLIVPLAFVIMATALLALGGGIVSTTLAAIFNNANWVFTHVLLFVVQAFSSLPGSFIYIGNSSPTVAQVTVFDFGAGGAAAVQCGRRLWLLDSGSQYQAEEILRPFLRSRGRGEPDGLLVSHGDARHIGGASGWLGTRVWDTTLDDRSSTRERFHRELEKRGQPITVVRPGNLLEWAPNVALKILHPPPDLKRDVADDKVIVARLDAAATRVLFLSDAGFATQEWLLKHSAADLPADVLVAGRHRSGLLMDRAFIEAVHPSVLIVTVSHFPANEPLDDEWARMVREMGIRLFRQDETGAVTVEIWPDRFRVAGFVDGREFVSTRVLRVD